MWYVATHGWLIMLGGVTPLELQRGTRRCDWVSSWHRDTWQLDYIRNELKASKLLGTQLIWSWKIHTKSRRCGPSSGSSEQGAWKGELALGCSSSLSLSSPSVPLLQSALNNQARRSPLRHAALMNYPDHTEQANLMNAPLINTSITSAPFI